MLCCRQGSMVPIIVLSARAGEKDKVIALDLGANDYITKPFGTAEIRTSLRVNRMNLQATGPNRVFSLGAITIDYERRQVCVGGQLIHMTQTEYNILSYLSQHLGKAMTYSSIINAVWGGMDDGSIKKLQVNMANIRRKLGCKPGEMVDYDPGASEVNQLNRIKLMLSAAQQATEKEPISIG